MDLRRLQHFIALAEEGRFALAARRVHLSQAAFSRSIQALEQQLDLRLFDRGAEGAHLTPAGEAVLARAQRLVFESGCLARDIQLIKTGDIGEMTIGVAPVPASVILPELISRLKREHPKLLIRTRMGNLRQLLAQLDAQEVDFCMGDPRLIQADPRYAMMALGDHAGGFYCRPSHPAARRSKADTGVLKEFGLATIALTRVLQDELAQQLGFTAEEFPQAAECDDVNTLAHLVANSDVIGLLPHTIISQSRKRLRRLQVQGARAIHAQVHAIWLSGRTQAPATMRAVQLARKVSQELIAQARV